MLEGLPPPSLNTPPTHTQRKRKVSGWRVGVSKSVCLTNIARTAANFDCREGSTTRKITFCNPATKKFDRVERRDAHLLQ
jgi:hypothetical protein